MPKSGGSIVFLGPSLPLQEAKTCIAADYRPPAAMGDITRAASENPAAIVLIDGTFESGLSVWHKEILWALARGIAVIGGASMGALRAAELYQYGMAGHGNVFEAFKTGLLKDDDEVAVVHAPAELHFRPLTDSMVDIRSGIAHATSEGLISEDIAAEILHKAKAMHFKQRHFATAVRDAMTARYNDSKITHLLSWLAHRNYSVKAEDTRSILRNLDYLIDIGLKQARNVPPFIPTVYLRRLEPFGYTLDDRHIQEGKNHDSSACRNCNHDVYVCTE